jgi:hypothetical protein
VASEEPYLERNAAPNRVPQSAGRRSFRNRVVKRPDPTM